MDPNAKTVAAALKTVAALSAYTSGLNEAGRAALTSAQENLDAATGRQVADAAIMICKTMIPAQIDPSTLRSYLTRYDGESQRQGPQ